MLQRWRASVCEPLMSPMYKQSRLGQFNCSPNVLSSLVGCCFQLVLGSQTFMNLCSVYWLQKKYRTHRVKVLCRWYDEIILTLNPCYCESTIQPSKTVVKFMLVPSHSKLWMQLLIFSLYPKIAILLPGNFRINCATVRKKRPVWQQNFKPEGVQKIRQCKEIQNHPLRDQEVGARFNQNQGTSSPAKGLKLI